jgi:uncharacterized protein with PIN domain
MPVGELCFACDAMLGRLARWLRFAGFDTTFLPDTPDPAVAGQARAEGRWLLTRDRRLAAAAGPRVVLLRGRTVGEQVAELRARLPLAARPERFFTRCSCCNGRLAEVSRETVREKVPPYVAVHASHFLACPGCGRVYWPGTHPGRIAHALEAWFLL